MNTQNKDDMESRIRRVQEVVKDQTEEQVGLVLEHFDQDVEKTIQCFMKDGAKSILSSWIPSGRNKRKNRKNKTKEKHRGTADKQNGYLPPPASIPEVPCPEPVVQPLTDDQSPESHRTDVHTVIPTFPHDPQVSPSECLVDPLDDFDQHIPKANTDLSFSPNSDDIMQQSNSDSREQTPEEGASVRPKNLHKLQKQKKDNRSRHPRTISEQSAASIDASSPTDSVDQKQLHLMAEKIQRHLVSLTRLTNVNNAEMEEQTKCLKKACEKLQDLLLRCEADSMYKLDQLAENSKRILKKREQEAHALKNRVLSATPQTFQAVKADVKKYHSEQKYEEAVRRNCKLIMNLDAAIQAIEDFVYVPPVTNPFTTPHTAVNTLPQQDKDKESSFKDAVTQTEGGELGQDESEVKSEEPLKKEPVIYYGTKNVSRPQNNSAPRFNRNQTQKGQERNHSESSGKSDTNSYGRNKDKHNHSYSAPQRNQENAGKGERLNRTFSHDEYSKTHRDNFTKNHSNDGYGRPVRKYHPNDNRPYHSGPRGEGFNKYNHTDGHSHPHNEGYNESQPDNEGYNRKQHNEGYSDRHSYNEGYGDRQDYDEGYGDRQAYNGEYRNKHPHNEGYNNYEGYNKQHRNGGGYNKHRYDMQSRPPRTNRYNRQPRDNSYHRDSQGDNYNHRPHHDNYNRGRYNNGQRGPQNGGYGSNYEDQAAYNRYDRPRIENQSHYQEYNSVSHSDNYNRGSQSEGYNDNGAGDERHRSHHSESNFRHPSKENYKENDAAHNDSQSACQPDVRDEGNTVNDRDDSHPKDSRDRYEDTERNPMDQSNCGEDKKYYTSGYIPKDKKHSGSQQNSESDRSEQYKDDAKSEMSPEHNRGLSKDVCNTPPRESVNENNNSNETSQKTGWSPGEWTEDAWDKDLNSNEAWSEM